MTKAPGRIQSVPMVLLPYQQRWIADTAPVKVAEKSRRTGFSWAEAADDALLASSERGMDVWYIGYNKDMAREFIEDCAEWAKYYDLAASDITEEEEIFKDGDDEKAILAFVIRFGSGFKITALSSRPSNLRGKQGKVVIDEAAFHDALGELIKAAMALLMWGGRVVIISTHNGDDNPFNELITAIRAGKLPYSLHRVTFDDALAEGLYQRICLRLGRDWSPELEAAWREEIVTAYGDGAGEELFCVPSHGSEIFFPGALVKATMDADIPVIRWQQTDEFTYLPESVREAATLSFCNDNLKPIIDALPENWPCWLGQDFARSGDLTVMLPVQELPGLRYRSIFGLELRNMPFEQQKQILFFILDRLPRFRGAALDARGNGQWLAEVAAQRYGPNRVQRVMISREWYRDAMPKYKCALEDRSIVLPEDGDIIDDHRLIRMDKGVAQIPDGAKTKGRDGKQRHGDSAIAAVLVKYAIDNVEGGVIEFRATNTTRAAADLAGYLEN